MKTFFVNPTLNPFISPKLFTKLAAGSAFALPTQSTVLVAIQVRTYAADRKGKKMPPKKAVKEEKIWLGRPGNNLKSGIVCTVTLDRLRNTVLMCL